jgi:CRISPR-associated endoribonuclease Cas6/Csy4 subtype I-F
MDNLFYVKITLGGNEHSDDESAAQDLLASVLTRVHRAACGRKFALSFPELTDAEEDARASLGRVIQIMCCARSDIEYILDSESLRRLLRESCVVSPVRTITQNMIVGWERYVRDRRNDKKTPSAQRRAARRREAGISAAKAIVDGCELIAETERGNLPYFDHQSLSTASAATGARIMRIYIRRITSSKPVKFSFDSFGLSRPKSNVESLYHGAVPILRNAARQQAYADSTL